MPPILDLIAILLNVRPVFLEHEAYIWAVLAAVLLSIYVFPLVSRMRWIFSWRIRSALRCMR